jgi:hypothetical protein
MGDHDIDRPRFPRRITDAANPVASKPPPGKATLVTTATAASPQPAAGPNGIYAPPGDLWNPAKLLPPNPVVTGNAVVDHGTGCLPVRGAPEHGPCFLDPVQRQLLLNAYQQYVDTAKDEYLDAVNDVKLEELLRTEPQQTEWLFELFLDVLSLGVSSAIKNVVRRLHGASFEPPSLISDQQRVINEVSAMSEASVTALFAGFFGRQRQSAHAAEATRSADAKRSASGTFFAALKRDASIRFHHLQHTVPAGANDAELLVLLQVMEPSGHTTVLYAEQIRAKLDRFKPSALSKVGVQRNDVRPIDAIAGNADDVESHFRIATKLFWVNTPVGRRLALYRRGHFDAPTRVVPPGRCISQRATPEEVAALEHQDLQARPFQFYKYVPAEFMSVAMELHHAKWRSEPEEHPLGYAELRASAWDR